jgi:predicted DsbA family dithiol-disulfide isomerase
MAAPLVVDVWADVACPWCWMGTRRLAAALRDEPPGSVEVRRRAFELRPGLPAEGIPREEAYAQTFGSRDAMLAAAERVAQAGAPDGLRFDFERQARMPNTRLAHRLVKLADAAGRGAEALEALFHGHFAEGADLADPEQAIALLSGGAVGLRAEALRAALELGAGEAEVIADEQTAERLDVTGVPFFLAGGAVALSGAHEAGLLRRLIAAGRERAAAAPAPD